MKVYCPNCKQTHDIAIKAILAEADRLRAVRNGRPAGAKYDPSAQEVDGNVPPEPIDAINNAMRGKRGCKEASRG